MILVGMTAVRRRMRSHQGIPPRRPRLPLWRLLLGEARWALAQLRREPRVLAALLAGAAVTIAVLGAAAPGPNLPWPGRVVAGLLAGLAIARGTSSWVGRDSDTARRGPGAGPVVAATEVVAVGVVLVLLGWSLVWLVTHIG